MVIEVQSLDEGGNTFIKIGCYRETWRLDRVLRAFQKALSLAHADDRLDDLRCALESLHDCKGELTARWRSASLFPAMRQYVDKAWADEGECYAVHEFSNGTIFFQRAITHEEQTR